MSTRHSGAGRNPEKQNLDPGLRRGDGVVDRRDDFVVVCRLDDIVPNTGVCALVAGRQIAVFRLDDDSVYAVDNLDPFSRANVLSRGIVGDLKGELVVASPVYKQHFSLVTGQCQEDAEVRIGVYPVRVDSGRVLVSVQQSLVTPAQTGVQARGPLDSGLRRNDEQPHDEETETERAIRAA